MLRAVEPQMMVAVAMSAHSLDLSSSNYWCCSCVHHLVALPRPPQMHAHPECTPTPNARASRHSPCSHQALRQRLRLESTPSSTDIITVAPTPKPKEKAKEGTAVR